MTNELLKSYTKRITSASRSELVVIIYEVILTDLNDSIEAFDQGNSVQFEKSLKHSKRFLKELMASLDYRHKISYELMSLYIYVDKLIVAAMFQRNKKLIEDVIIIMKDLMIGFEGVSKEDSTGPVMKNTEQIYAGLTYGKGVLNEISLDDTSLYSVSSKRGFKA